MENRHGATALLILLVLSAGCLASCGSSDDDSSGPVIAASTGIWGDVTEQVAGEDAGVEQIIPDASSPHEFQLSAQDRARIEDSILFVYNGADLEAGIPIDEISVPKFAVADHVGELRPFEEDGEVGEDPHVWMDPSRVVAALPSLAAALAEADPEHADGYRQRAQAYAGELRSLDAEIKRMLERLRPGDRKLVTSHDALGYFADHYGFRVIATPFPASGPEAETSAKTIVEVEKAIETERVPVVFSEETDDPEVLELIAEGTGVQVEENLLVESPGDAPSYVEMLRRDAALISASLSGK